MEKERTNNNKEMLSDYAELAILYAQVFAGPPWNEFTRSINCDTFFGLETNVGDMCPNCGDLLEEAYPVENTISYIGKELSRPNAFLITRFEDENLVGFAWGFSYENPEKFLKEKYKTEEMRGLLSEVFRQEWLQGPFYYLSECGVKPEYRGRGLSNEVSGELVTMANQLKLPLIMRTNYQSPMVYVAQRFGMDQIMGPRDTEIINVLDLENTSRVLFLRKSQ